MKLKPITMVLQTEVPSDSRSASYLGKHCSGELSFPHGNQRRQLCAQGGWAAESTAVSGRKPVGSNAGEHKGCPEYTTWVLEGAREGK